jgi:hypothetical protein
MTDNNSIGAGVGVRLREARLQTGLTVREVAPQPAPD